MSKATKERKQEDRKPMCKICETRHFVHEGHKFKADVKPIKGGKR